MTAGDAWQDTGNSRRSAPSIGPWARTLAMGRPIEATPVSRPWARPSFRPYVYRGTGRDELTPWMDDEPDNVVRISRRQERMEYLASLRIYTGHNVDDMPPGYITAHQAAELLGVNVRTIERYKRDLAGRAS